MLKIKTRKTKKLKWGIAGLGRFAEHTFIPSMEHVRKGTVVSVFSNNLTRAKDFAFSAGIQNYFENYEQFLQSGIDAVYVAGANQHHYEQVIKAAKAGKHILCEKPVALYASEAEEMVKICKENKVQFAVNYIFRFHPLIVKAKEFIEDGKLGKLVSMQLNFNANLPPGENFRNKKETGGGALRDLGTHMIDLLRYFGGEITAIEGVADDVIYKTDVDDYAAGIVKFDNGGYGHFNVSFSNKKAFNRIEILGHTGALSIENLIGVKHAPAKITLLLDGEAKKTFMKRSHRMVPLLKAVNKAFLKNEPAPVTGEDGLAGLKLIEELERKSLFR